MSLSIKHFIHMGGYAYYVWPAYGIAVGVLFGLWQQSRKQYRRLKQEVEEQLHARQTQV